MLIEFTDAIYVSNEEINEMVAWCKECGATPEDAFWNTAAGWDDCDYYNAGKVETKVVEVIKKLLAGEKVDFD